MNLLTPKIRCILRKLVSCTSQWRRCHGQGLGELESRWVCIGMRGDCKSATINKLCAATAYATRTPVNGRQGRLDLIPSLNILSLVSPPNFANANAKVNIVCGEAMSLTGRCCRKRSDRPRGCQGPARSRPGLDHGSVAIVKCSLQAFAEYT
jgi:hypothetical protein